jgi:anti-anti-sigma factor
VTLPEHIDVSNVDRIREQLLGLVNRGASPLIADMTGTVSCDQAGAGALLRVYQRASANGTRLRVVVAAALVRRVLEVAGLDRLVSIYPSVEAAIAPGPSANVIPLESAQRSRRAAASGSRRPTRAAVVGSAVLLGLVDALADGVVLADGDGTIALANRRAEDMFGYAHGEMTGRPIESLIPADLREAHVIHRADYDSEPRARPMGARARLVGLRKDGGTFPVQISLSPVPTASGHFTLAVIRDSSGVWPRTDLGDLARAAAAAQHSRQSQELLDRVVNRLFHVGLSLQAAIELPHDVARQRIADGLTRLDDTIRDIRNHVFADRDQDGPPTLPDGARLHPRLTRPTKPEGLARTCLGLLRALDRRGVRVAFVKPVAQPRADGGPDRSAARVTATRG